MNEGLALTSPPVQRSGNATNNDHFSFTTYIFVTSGAQQAISGHFQYTTHITSGRAHNGRSFVLFPLISPGPSFLTALQSNGSLITAPTLI